MKNYGITSDPTLFFFLKNLFMILEDHRRIGLLYMEYKNSRVKKCEMRDVCWAWNEDKLKSRENKLIFNYY